jgi:hypothetical protein
MMRNLEFIFRPPGLVEAIASDPDENSDEVLITEGYRSIWVADLMADYLPQTNQVYSFMCQHFHKTYPLVIWALKMYNTEVFNVPQMGASNVPLHEAFSWAYYHFILEDGKQLHKPFTSIKINPLAYTQVALGYALTTT